MDFLADESALFDGSLQDTNVLFIEAITEYVESWEEHHYVTEVAADTIGVKIKKFFANLIALMQNLKSSIQSAVEHKVRDAQYRAKLDKAYKDIMKKKEDGETSVEVIDIQGIESELDICVMDMKSYASRLCKMQYKSTLKIDKDIEEFNTHMDNWNKRMDKVFQLKKRVSINKAIKMIEYERSGRTKCLDYINDSITILKQMEDDVKLIETRKDILGPDIIPKHIGFIRKIATGISSAIKRWVVKVVSTIVFVFA